MNFHKFGIKSDVIIKQYSYPNIFVYQQSSMKNQRRKTHMIKTNKISLKQIRHRSLIPTTFEHDILIELFMKKIVNEIADDIVERIEGQEQIKETANAYIGEQMNLFVPFMMEDPQFLCKNEQPFIMQPESQPKYSVKNKDKIARISTVFYKKQQNLQRQSSHINDNSLAQKQILAKLKKENRDKLKWSKQNLPPIKLHTMKEEQDTDNYVNKSLRVFKKYARQLQDSLNQTHSKLESKSIDEFTYGIDGRPIKMKRIETQLYPIKAKKNPKIIKAELLDTRILTNTTKDIVKYRVKLSKTDHRAGALTEKNKVSGDIAEASIMMGFRSVGKGVRMRQKNIVDSCMRSRSSFVKFPKI